MSRFRSLKRFAAQFMLIVLLVVSSSATVLALARGFNTDDPGLKPGMVVAITDGDDRESPKVERASNENAQRAIGIVTTDGDSSVTLSSGTKQVLVEMGGEVDAYVSDINGVVKQGELLEISPLRGILMKADNFDGVILGIALEDAKMDDENSYSVDISGEKKSARITRVRISLDQKAISSAPQQIDSSIERLGRSIVGKDVSEIRVMVALIIFIMVLIAEGGIIYGAVSSAITSLGRNPLARNVIKSEMTRVLVVALIVLLIGLAAIYMILWV